jgi:hypothetical protein
MHEHPPQEHRSPEAMLATEIDSEQNKHKVRREQTSRRRSTTISRAHSDQRPCTPGAANGRPSDADLDTFARRIKESGIEVEKTAAGEQPGLGRRLSFIMPTGHRIELFAEMALSDHGFSLDSWHEVSQAADIIARCEIPLHIDPDMASRAARRSTSSILLETTQ